MKEISVDTQYLPPHPQLPKPEPPRGRRVENLNPPKSSPEKFTVDMMKFIRQSRNAISKTLSFSSENAKDDSNADLAGSDVTEFEISGIKVLVKLKSEEEIKGRITFFSRSNCRDSTAVRSFLRERSFDFLEINIDVYTEREKELIERTGSSQVPQIFFNEKHFGGLISLNSLRNSGEFDRRIKEFLSEKCSGDAPTPPLYGFDEESKDVCVDEMMRFVKVLRQKLPIKDRLMKMKITKNCFSGGEMVEILIDYLDCGRKKAVEIGKKLAKKHFIHNVFGENDFEDGNNYYRFLEHEPFISKCYNFRGSTNDMEPQNAAVVGQKLFKIMSAILESYSSDDHSHVNYTNISQSEEFRRYLNLSQDLHRLNLLELSTNDEKLTFFLNLYNAMVIHALVKIGRPEGIIARRSFFTDFQYVVGGYSFSLSSIRNDILRGGRKPLYSFITPFTQGNTRPEFGLQKLNPLVHFGLCDGTKSSPMVRFYTPQGVEAELKRAARDFFKNGAIEIVLDKRVINLSRIIKWYKEDFGHEEKKMLKWIMSYIDANKAGLLTHLLNDGGGSVHILYQDYDWSINN
ncbi:unnamed protein product [Cochlearia groenlandica]